MAASVLGYFGLGNSTATAAQPDPTKAPIRALPAQWYTSPEMYQFERRAIFSRRWLFITNKSRLQEPGDYLRYTMADYDFVITLDRQHNIRAFHNVCRHRAYPVVEDKEGKAKIFMCRYHGWTYGLNGKLAKAPNYQDLEGFDKEQNGLFPIHVHVDSKGFIWINMDANETPEVAWEDQFQDVDNQERFDQFNFDDYVFDHTYEMQGNYNWKILADNFNECYHCKTTHPDVPNFLTIDAADVEGKRNSFLEHDHKSTPEQRAKGFNVNSTYYHPNASMSIAPHFMMIQKFLPAGPTQSSMHYEVYRNKHSSEEDFRLIADTYARVMSEDKVLCDGAQKNLNRGVFNNGQLHPRWERGPLYFQQSIRGFITEHYQREKKEAREIWPARPKAATGLGADISESDMEICNGLGCGEKKEELAW